MSSEDQFRGGKDMYNETLFGNKDPFYFQQYKYDKDLDYVKVGPEVYDLDKIYNRTDKYYNANEMAKKIREYDRTNFIVVISNYAWESYFSDDLGRTLENCGAFLVKEFMH